MPASKRKKSNLRFKTRNSATMKWRQIGLIGLIATAGSIVFLLLSVYVPIRVNSVSTSILLSEISAFDTPSEQLFIEIYNPTLDNINVNNFTIKKLTGSPDNSQTLVTLQGVMKPRGYLLISNGTANLGADLLFTTDINGLVRGDTIAVYDQAGQLVDLVGMGENALAEGDPVEIQPLASIERKASQTSTTETMSVDGSEYRSGNAYDSDNNLADFVMRTIPEPQNSAKPSEPKTVPSPTVAPSPTPSSTPIPSITPVPSAAPEPTSTPLPPTSTPEPTSTPLPTSTPTPEPTLTPTPEPTSTPLPPTPTVTTRPTPTPQTFLITTRNRTLRCTVTSRRITTFWGVFTIPDIQCVRI